MKFRGWVGVRVHKFGSIVPNFPGFFGGGAFPKLPVDFVSKLVSVCLKQRL